MSFREIAALVDAYVTFGEIMLNYLIKLLKAFNANVKPNQISNSFCIGLLLGFMPKNNLLWYVLLVFFAFVRISKPGYFIMIIAGSGLAYFLDPLFDSVGYAILSFASLQNFFSKLFDVPFVGFTRLNNTMVIGSFAAGLAVYAPLYVVSIFLIKFWRKNIAPKFNNSKFLKTVYRIPALAKIFSKTSASL